MALSSAAKKLGTSGANFSGANFSGASVSSAANKSVASPSGGGVIRNAKGEAIASKATVEQTTQSSRISVPQATSTSKKSSGSSSGVNQSVAPISNVASTQPAISKATVQQTTQSSRTQVPTGKNIEQQKALQQLQGYTEAASYAKLTTQGGGVDFFGKPTGSSTTTTTFSKSNEPGKVNVETKTNVILPGIYGSRTVTEKGTANIKDVNDYFVDYSEARKESQKQSNLNVLTKILPEARREDAKVGGSSKIGINQINYLTNQTARQSPTKTNIGLQKTQIIETPELYKGDTIRKQDTAYFENTFNKISNLPVVKETLDFTDKRSKFFEKELETDTNPFTTTIRKVGLQANLLPKTAVIAVSKTISRSRTLSKNPIEGIKITGREVKKANEELLQSAFQNPSGFATDIIASEILFGGLGRGLKKVGTQLKLPEIKLDIPKSNNKNYVILDNNPIEPTVYSPTNQLTTILSKEELALVEASKTRQRTSDIFSGSRELNLPKSVAPELTSQEAVKLAVERSWGIPNKVGVQTLETYIAPKIYHPSGILGEGTGLPLTIKDVKPLAKLSGTGKVVGALSKEELALVEASKTRQRTSDIFSGSRELNLPKSVAPELTSQEAVKLAVERSWGIPNKVGVQTLEPVINQDYIFTPFGTKIKIADLVKFKSDDFDLPKYQSGKLRGGGSGSPPASSAPLVEVGFNRVRTKSGQIMLERIGGAIDEVKPAVQEFKVPYEPVRVYKKQLYDKPISRSLLDEDFVYRPNSEVTLEKSFSEEFSSIQKRASQENLVLNKLKFDFIGLGLTSQVKSVGVLLGKQDQLGLQLSKQDQLSLSLNKELDLNKTLELNRELDLNKELSISKSKSITKQKTEQVLEQITQQVSLTKIKFPELKLKTTERFKKEEELKFPSYSSSTKKKEIEGSKKKKKGFNVLVRRKGKLVRINNASLTELGALALGAKFVNESSAATFYVRPSTQEAISTGNESLFSREAFKFNLKRTGDLIKGTEKNKFRISTGGELREITALGIRASKSLKATNVKGYLNTRKKKSRFSL